MIDNAAELDNPAAAKQEAQGYLGDIEDILRTAAAAVNEFSQQAELQGRIKQLEADLQVTSILSDRSRLVAGILLL